MYAHITRCSALVERGQRMGADEPGLEGEEQFALLFPEDEFVLGGQARGVGEDEVDLVEEGEAQHLVDREALALRLLQLRDAALELGGGVQKHAQDYLVQSPAETPHPQSQLLQRPSFQDGLPPALSIAHKPSIAIARPRQFGCSDDRPLKACININRQNCITKRGLQGLGQERWVVLMVYNGQARIALAGYIILMMQAQKQEQKIKTIDLNDFLDGFHNYRTSQNDHEALRSHPFAVKLRSHLNARAETCFSIQACTPHSRPPSRRPPSRYETARPAREGLVGDLENINLDEFVHAIVARGRGEERGEGGESGQAQEFMRTLNGTWFQGTSENFRCANIYNTLGIKKSRSAVRPRADRYNPELLRERVDFTKQFKQNGIFPSRRTNSYNLKKLAKSSTAAHASPTKNNEGSLKYQIARSIKNELEGRDGRLEKEGKEKRGSARPGRKAYTSVGSPFNNEKLAGKAQQAIVKGIRMLIYD